jgi:hypothetical protein
LQEPIAVVGEAWGASDTWRICCIMVYFGVR